MTTKTVAVNLVAMTGQYQASMAKATASTAKLQATSAATGKGIGAVMGPQIALGAAIAAGAAVKMALDFDNAFTRIAAVTNTSQAQVGQWKEQVLSLAGEVAIAPKELAEALYFLASAGLDANEVMPTLEASAKAAASGLGETADIARLTANAMNAYSASGLTATQVTDTLVAAVRSGTAEPDEFADAMGRILPIAAKAGISFDQVAASLAGLSNIGLDVNEGVTAMRGVMVALLAPGKQAADQLDELGLSADDVRRSLAEDGLIATLRMLETATGGNIDKLRKIIPNVRAMAGAFGLTGQEAAKVDKVFKDVMNSAGSTEKSFNKTAESAGHKLRQAFVDLQKAGIELGAALLPVFVALAEGASALASAVGPLVDVFTNAQHAVVRYADELGRAVIPGENYAATANAIRDALAKGKITVDQAHDAINRFGEANVFAGHEVAGLHQEVGEVTSGMQRAEMVAGGYTGNLAGVGNAATEAAPPVDAVGRVVEATGRSLEDAEKAADGFAAALDALTKVAFDMEDAQLNWHQGLIDLRKELRAGAKTLDLNSQAGIDNREAMKGQLENALAIGIAMRQKGKSEEQATKATMDHVAQVRAEAIAAGFSKGEVDKYIRTLNLTPKQIRTIIANNAKAASADVDAYWQKLMRLNGMSVTTYVNQVVSTEDREVAHSGGVVGNLPRYHGGGRPKSDERLVLARKGEHILTEAQYRARPVAVGSTPRREDSRAVHVGVRLDRRRFTTELDHDATYDGRWAS